MICIKCKKDKPESEFYNKGANRKDTRCRECIAIYSLGWRNNNKDLICIRRRKNNIKYKNRVVNHYGGKCVCCGERDTRFLTIDHINGGGRKHRESIKQVSGVGFYRWIVRNNFPNDLQILCFNCNCGRKINNGICPHKETE